MATETEVQAALDVATQTALGDTPVAFTNHELGELLLGETNFVKQRVEFTEANQFELGSPARSRKWGVLLFMIHVRRNTGSAAKNALQAIIVNSFRSARVGGATLLNARSRWQGESERWSVTSVEIPFYFHDGLS